MDTRRQARPLIGVGAMADPSTADAAAPDSQQPPIVGRGHQEPTKTTLHVITIPI